MLIQRLFLCVFCLLISLEVMANKTLTLYTSQPNKDAQATVAAFKQAHPDIDVTWIRDGTTKLMTRLNAELSAGVVKPDILLIADSVTMEGLKARGYLAPYKSKHCAHFPSSLYDKQGYYHGTKLITSGIVYHTQAAHKPTSWQDLVQKAYKNQVAMPSPLYSGAALIHLATLTENPKLGWNYYRRLQANGAKAQGGNGGVLKAVTSGSKPYGVIVDFLAIRARQKGTPIEFVYPQEGVSMVTEPVAIMKNSKHSILARKFVDFVLSDKGQELVKQQGYLPAAKHIALPAGFPKREHIKLMPFNARKALDNAEKNKQLFSQIFTK